MSAAGGAAFVEGARAGADERELEWAVDAAMLRKGADARAFRTLLFSGDLVATGIGFARQRRLENGEQANVVCGSALHGYRTEVGRVVTIGGASPAAARVMNAASEMHAAMLAATRPGRPVRELAAEAVRVADQYGLGDYLYRSANAGPGYGGHGMGCWYSEFPDINTEVDDVLEPNILLILEARLGIPHVAGATITDPVLVTRVASNDWSTCPSAPGPDLPPLRCYVQRTIRAPILATTRRAADAESSSFRATRSSATCKTRSTSRRSRFPPSGSRITR